MYELDGLEISWTYGKRVDFAIWYWQNLLFMSLFPLAVTPEDNPADPSRCFLPCGLHTQKDFSLFFESPLLENIAASGLFWDVFWEKEKPECVHRLKFAQVLRLWFSKALKGGLNFKMNYK